MNKYATIYTRVGDVMKIKTKNIDYSELLKLPKPKHKPPMKQLAPLRGLIRLLSLPDYIASKFEYTEERMELIGKNQPCLILMNHSCFLDLKIAFKMFRKRFSVIATMDSFVGKAWIMRLLGCIPTQKFVSDITLLSDIQHAIEKNNSSVLMFPEAGYSFDGRATSLPHGLGMLLKRLNVPVVTVITDGAYLRTPLFNELKNRKTKVTAHVSCLLTPEEMKEKSVKELDAIIDNAFSFDAYAKQYETKRIIDEPYRAKGLERILYRCPHCNTDGQMHGDGTEIYCKKCGKDYEMDAFGRMCAKNGETEFAHIPDWYNWQRECVRKEIENGEYCLETEVKIGVMRDHKAYYTIGEGILVHDENGFRLTGCDGRLEYSHSPLASHTINADFYWYTIGDCISIGNREILYYCFPKAHIPVAKIRLAAEEIYKIKRAEKRIKK